MGVREWPQGTLRRRTHRHSRAPSGMLLPATIGKEHTRCRDVLMYTQKLNVRAPLTIASTVVAAPMIWAPSISCS